MLFGIALIVGRDEIVIKKSNAIATNLILCILFIHNVGFVFFVWESKLFFNLNAFVCLVCWETTLFWILFSTWVSVRMRSFSPIFCFHLCFFLLGKFAFVSFFISEFLFLNFFPNCGN